MPFAVENHSPVPHFGFFKTGPSGDRFCVLAVRATFDWVHGGVMTISAEQEPVIVADRYKGERAAGDLRLESDMPPPTCCSRGMCTLHKGSRGPLGMWPFEWVTSVTSPSRCA